MVDFDDYYRHCCFMIGFVSKVVRHDAYRAVTSRIWISKIFQIKCAGQIILRQDSGVGGTPVIIGREEMIVHIVHGRDAPPGAALTL